MYCLHSCCLLILAKKVMLCTYQCHPGGKGGGEGGDGDFDKAFMPEGMALI